MHMVSPKQFQEYSNIFINSHNKMVLLISFSPYFLFIDAPYVTFW